jgi:lysophospholipase L1-like esterase
MGKVTSQIMSKDMIDSKNKAEKSNKSIARNSPLYNQAINDLNTVIFDLPNARNALNNGAIKIAATGNSIIEGFNNYYSDFYFNLFVDAVKKANPTTTVNSTNFGLGGRGISQWNDSNYKAVNPETSTSTNFWRSWATVGKSWQQHLVDYAPDILLIEFGMNDVSGNLSDYNFMNQLNTMVSYLQTNLPNTDIVIGVTMLPTENKSVYNQSSEQTLQIARATREYCKNNKIAFFDTNRLWKILLYGVDEEKFTTLELNGVNSKIIEGITCYNFELNIGLGFYGAYSDATDITFRGNGSAGGILLRFYNSGTNKIDVFSMDSGLSSGGTFIETVNATATNNIIFQGSKITINGTAITLYKHLRDGLIHFVSRPEYVNYVNFYRRINLTENPVYTELDLLGNVNTGSNVGNTGNGINHPTSLGTYLNHFTACMPIIKALKKSINKTIVTLNFINSWGNAGGTYSIPTRAIKSNGIINIDATIYGGTITANTVLTTLPVGYRPQFDCIFIIATTDNYSKVLVKQNGEISLMNALTSNGWITLNNISFVAA